MINTNGITLHVVEEGEGKPVIFCHGFPDTWRGWRRQIDAVAAAGYRAIAFDQRGFGRSSCPADYTQYTPFQTVGDLVGLLEALQLPDATLVGHDFGALTAWQAGLMRPDLFTAIYAVSVPFAPRGEKSFLQHLREAGRTDFYMFDQMTDEAVEKWRDAARTIPGALYAASATPPPAERWTPFSNASLLPANPPMPPWADKEDVAYTIEEYQRTGFATGLNYYKAFQLGFDLAAPFKGAKIHQPCYFAVGREEAMQAILGKSLEQFREDMPGLRGVEIFDDCGHWVAQEKPEQLNASILKFLANKRTSEDLKLT